MLDMYCTAENLVSSLIANEVRVGQAGSPIVFVGHCLGGLVLKELCLTAAGMMGRKRENMPGMDRIKDLLSNIRGMFFYGTPHNGSLLGDKLDDMLENYFKGVLLEEMETLKVSSARRNQDFEHLKSKYEWITAGMGELRKTYAGQVDTPWILTILLLLIITTYARQKRRRVVHSNNLEVSSTRFWKTDYFRQES